MLIVMNDKDRKNTAAIENTIAASVFYKLKKEEKAGNYTPNPDFITTKVIEGDTYNVIYVDGADREHRLSIDKLAKMDGVKEIIGNFNYRNLTSLREFKRTTDTVKVGGCTIGNSGTTAVIAGPCSIYSLGQAKLAAAVLADADVDIMRVGIDKERTSPYAFQGLGSSSPAFLRVVAMAHRKNMSALGLAIMDSSDIDNYINAGVDMIQVGTRYGQAYGMFKKIAPKMAKYDIPVLLKRNWGAKVSEWLGAAEYFYNSGVDVVLCERGIRDTANGFTGDVDWLGARQAVEQSHFPIVIDPCHATSNLNKIRAYTPEIVKQNFDGIMLEADCNPEKAYSDAKNTLDARSELPKIIEEIRLLDNIKSCNER